MRLEELAFPRPPELEAREPPEARGVARDEVKLLVTGPGGTIHRSFRDLPRLLPAGTLLVVNDSATVPASLPAAGPPGAMILNLATRFGPRTWLAEPRWGPGEPGPLPLEPGDALEAGGVPVHLLAPYPGLPRLWFVRARGSLEGAMERAGEPIRYGYAAGPRPLADYRTAVSRVPGSAEMPSAARPLTRRVLAGLRDRGVEVRAVTLHCGVSSVEVATDRVEDHPLAPEPVHVPAATARAAEAARREGRPVVAVGTTVVRALESALRRDGRVGPLRGFTRRFVHPGAPPRVVTGLVTGLHDPRTSHLALLSAFLGSAGVRRAYREAVAEGYRWHEFGDSHLILPGAAPGRIPR